MNAQSQILNAQTTPQARVAPRPAGWPLVGNLFDMLDDPARFFAQTYEALGPVYEINLLGRRVKVLAGPEANLFVSKQGREHFSAQDFWTPMVHEFGGQKGLINTDGEFHSRLRKVMRRGFARSYLKGRYEELTDITRGELQAGWAEGSHVNVVHAMQRMAAQQLGVMVVGRAPGAYVNDLRTFIRTALNVLVTQHWPKVCLYSPSYRKAKARVFELGEEMIAQWDPDGPRPHGPTLIDDIMNAAQTEDDLFTHGELRMAVLGPYFAGLDTVANTTAAMLYRILKHPEIYDRVIAEVDAAFDAGPLTPEALRGMHNLHGTAMETLRLHPIAVATMRNAKKDFTFEGFDVKAGESVYLGLTVSHFLERFYPNPEKFDIDRFSKPRNEHRQAGAFAPFSLGEHTCLGAGMAEVQISVTLATLLRHLDLSLSPEDYELKTKVAPTPGPEMGFKVKVNGARHR